MKRLLFILIPVLLLVSGCSTAVENTVIIKSLAAETVYLNMFGKIITLKSNTTQTIKNIRKGDYLYSTSYEIPSGVQGASIEGNGEGTISMNAGTRVSMLYSSRIQVSTGSGSGGAQSSYILIVTLSSNDKVTTTTGP